MWSKLLYHYMICLATTSCVKQTKTVLSTAATTVVWIETCRGVGCPKMWWGKNMMWNYSSGFIRIADRMGKTYDYYFTKKKNKRISKSFGLLYNSRQNNRCQVELMCTDFNKIDDSEFDWKVCLRVTAWGHCVKLWPVIEWPSGYSDSTGGKVVKNPNRGWWESVVLIKEKCMNWQIHVDCKYEQYNSFMSCSNILLAKLIICHWSLFCFQLVSQRIKHCTLMLKEN